MLLVYLSSNYSVEPNKVKKHYSAVILLLCNNVNESESLYINKSIRRRQSVIRAHYVDMLIDAYHNSVFVF